MVLKLKDGVRKRSLNPRKCPAARVSRMTGAGVQNGLKTERRCAEKASKSSEMSRNAGVQNDRRGCPKCPSRPTGPTCPTRPSWTGIGGLVFKISLVLGFFG